MKKIQFQILSDQLLAEYNQKVSKDLKKDFEALGESELSIDAFSFYTSVAAEKILNWIPM